MVVIKRGERFRTFGTLLVVDSSILLHGCFDSFLPRFGLLWLEARFTVTRLATSRRIVTTRRFSIPKKNDFTSIYPSISSLVQLKHRGCKNSAHVLVVGRVFLKKRKKEKEKKEGKEGKKGERKEGEKKERRLCLT